MLATMLNPRFKSFQVVKNLVGCGEAIQLAFEYDLKVVIPLLMTYFATLNIIIECWTFVNHSDKLKNEGNVFGVGASFKESSWALVVKESFLFRRLSTHLVVACEDLFAWQCIHEGNF
jgi:hypothetical protein